MLEAGRVVSVVRHGLAPDEAPNPLRPDDEDSAAGFGISVPSNNKFRGGFSTRARRGELQSRARLHEPHATSATTRASSPTRIGRRRAIGNRCSSSVDGQRIERLERRAAVAADRAHAAPDAQPHRRHALRPLELREGSARRAVPDLAGHHHSRRRLHVRRSRHRVRLLGAPAVSGRIAYTDGEFYSGTRARTFGNVTWTPSPRFRTSMGFNMQLHRAAVRNGKFTTRIITTSFDIVFSSKLSWTNLIQYDNVSEVDGPEPAAELDPGSGPGALLRDQPQHAGLRPRQPFHSLTSDVVAKVSYTFRF